MAESVHGLDGCQQYAALSRRLPRHAMAPCGAPFFCRTTDMRANSEHLPRSNNRMAGCRSPFYLSILDYTMTKLFIEDLDLAGKRVLIRVDFNVPQDKVTGALQARRQLHEALH